MDQTSQSSTKSKPRTSLHIQPRQKSATTLEAPPPPAAAAAAAVAGTSNTVPSSTAAAAETSKNAGSKLPSSVNNGVASLRTMEHSFLTDVADVRQMEQGLLHLLEDFHLGKLQAFGQDCTFEKMDDVRERQERLARLHFELDSRHDTKVPQTSEARQESNKNLGKLMDNLQELCVSIQNLQQQTSSSIEQQQQQT